MDNYTVELFLWIDGGLKKTVKKYKDGRKTMDDAYAETWSVMKIYHDDVLMHQNSTSKEWEQYV